MTTRTIVTPAQARVQEAKNRAPRVCAWIAALAAVTAPVLQP